MRELAGRTAFVTGGASGIGFALGRAFAEAGMKVDASINLSCCLSDDGSKPVVRAGAP